jgi:hypothetical protein
MTENMNNETGEITEEMPATMRYGQKGNHASSKENLGKEIIEKLSKDQAEWQKTLDDLTTQGADTKEETAVIEYIEHVKKIVAELAVRGPTAKPAIVEHLPCVDVSKVNADTHKLVWPKRFPTVKGAKIVAGRLVSERELDPSGFLAVSVPADQFNPAGYYLFAKK